MSANVKLEYYGTGEFENDEDRFIDERWLRNFCTKETYCWRVNSSRFMLSKKSGDHYAWEFDAIDDDGVEEYRICVVYQRAQLIRLLLLLGVDIRESIRYAD